MQGRTTSTAGTVSATTLVAESDSNPLAAALCPCLIAQSCFVELPRMLHDM